ncbi:MAG: 6-phosphofructokinase [Culturomica sp.]|jgi:6-phosphofructokinase 1|nr:6-phosphofructokinase [Culturomica sp.]
MKTIAILCGGGPAPGINTVVATVAKIFMKDNYRVLAIHEGYKGLFSENPDIEELTFEKADMMFVLGGSMIRMSRHKPKDEEFSDRLFKQYGIELLVTIGGDDTASTANRLTKFLKQHNLQVSNIHVPKTIDNDLPLQEGVPTFGFMTAKEMGVNIAKIIKSEASTTQNWYVMMSMGREAGHLAYEIGKSIQSAMIIIPEMFEGIDMTLDKIVKLMISSVVKRRIHGRKFGVIVVSEGIFHCLRDADIEASGICFTYDAHGHPELGEVGKAHILNKLLCKKARELGIQMTGRPIEVGYSLRCVDPCAEDLSYCTTLGVGVKKLYEAGITGCMVSVDINRKIVPIYLSDVEDENGKIRPRLVNMHREEVKNTFTDMLFYLTEDDREKAKTYLENPEEYEWANIMK